MKFIYFVISDRNDFRRNGTEMMKYFKREANRVQIRL